MLSRSKIKEIKSLEYKKNRITSGLFVAEGTKLIKDLSDSGIQIELLVTTSRWVHELAYIKENDITEVIEVTDEEISKASLLRNPQGCLALFRIPIYSLAEGVSKDNLVICLDDIQDPGNLGTIVRLADWFGINHLVCSPSTADIFNPKVVQASMGAVGRVHVHYTDLKAFLASQKKHEVPVYGTFLDGENIFKSALTSHGVIVLGNEGKGIHNEYVPWIIRKITIPDFHSGSHKPDSLNVSIAASIVISEFRRISVNM
jgi:TrmH family RNA methyltransferase